MGLRGFGSVTFCSLIVMSVSDMLGRMKSWMLVAELDGLSKGYPIARLSGYNLSLMPQKLEACLHDISEPSSWVTWLIKRIKEKYLLYVRLSNRPYLL